MPQRAGSCGPLQRMVGSLAAARQQIWLLSSNRLTPAMIPATALELTDQPDGLGPADLHDESHSGKAQTMLWQTRLASAAMDL